MTVQHKDIPDAQRHEPKGASTASTNQVYAADGLGSGTWKKLTSNNFQGLAGDGGNANLKLVTDGTNGFVYRADAQFGCMTITNNTNAFGVTAAGDPTLQTNSDYSLFTGTGAPWVGEQNFGVSFSTNSLTVPVTGVYKVDAWANIAGYPTNTAFIGLKYRVNGVTFGPRRVKSKSNSAGDAGNLMAFGLAQLTAGDFIQMYIASSATGSLTISDANISLHLLRQSV